MKNKILFMLFALVASMALLSCGNVELLDNPWEDCGDDWYRPDQFCYVPTLTIYDKCNGSEYNPSTQYCSGGSVIKPLSSLSSSSSLEQGLVYCQLPNGCSSLSAETCALIGTVVAFCPASSSSSGLVNSSSSLTPSSSSSATKSSSSVSSSSSSSSKTSSSSAASSSSVANTYTPAPAITCTWAPETVLTGDKTTISISTTDANCTVFAGIAYGKLTPANGLTPAIDGRDTVVWLNGDQIIANSSKLVGKNGRGDTTFTISATAGTSTTQNHVKAFAYCSTGDKSGIFTQACALKIQVPPNPAKTGAMQWTNTHTSASSTEISSSSGYYYIGEVPAYSKGITVTNPDESRCGIVEYDETIATTAAGTNNIKVIAKCSQSGYKLDSIKASVLANPTLTGTCTWDTKNNTFGGGVSLTAKAPLVIINNSYGRCGATFFSQDGTTPITKVDTWEGGTGQTMTGVGVYVDCGVAGIVGPQVCPTITVEDPDAVFMDTPDGQI